MKIVYFDCFAGVSGDMILGALVDAGVQLTEIQSSLSKLPLGGYELKESEVKRNGIRGVKVDVFLDNTIKRKHVSYAEIREMIESSDLDSKIKKDSIKVFNKIAGAEAKIHCVDINKVHFHELGAVDSIVDIVGGVIGLSLLGADKFISSPINTGSGTVLCAHGTIPVPAPATAEMLLGIPHYSSGTEMELATPTGVGILTALCDSFNPIPLIKSSQLGYGAGSGEIKGFTNLLRITVGEIATDGFNETVSVIETNIDDMNPQFYDDVIDKLLKKGALDVFLTPIIMKKSRPAVKLSVITEVETENKLIDILLQETSTFGIRSYRANRKILDREFVDLCTGFGAVKGKVGKLNGKTIKLTPEYEDCRSLAEKNRVSVQEVYNEALIEAEKLKVKSNK